MKFAVMLLGVIFIVIAAMYFGLPANKLPAFVPGYDAALDQIHLKHAIAAAVVGIALLVVSMRMKRIAS